MTSYKYNANGDWCEVNPNTGTVIRVVDAAHQAQGEILPYTAQIPEAVPHHMIAPASTQQVVMKTSYRDRAEGFNLKTRWLALPVTAVSALLAWQGAQVPIFSGAMLTIIVITYALVWLAAYMWSELTSADGVALFHTWQGWRYLGREQRERHQHYRRQWRDGK